MFLSRNYRLIVAPQKFDVLKTNICPRSEASRANMLVLRTSNFQGATLRPVVSRFYCLYCSPGTKLFRTLVQKSIRIQLNYFQKGRKPNVKFERESKQKPLVQFQLFIFYETRLFTEKFSRKTIIHPGIFGGRPLSIRVLSADDYYPSGYFRWTGTMG